MNSRKILFITLPNMGGCQRVTINYAKILHTFGFKCEFLIWVDTANDSNEIQFYLPSCFPIHYINCRLRETPWKFYTFIKDQNGYDCVFCSWTLFNISLCLVRCLPFNKMKHLFIRDDNMPSRHSKFEQLSLRLLRFCPDLYIAQTKEMQEEAMSIYHIEKKSVVIHNPIDISLINDSVEISKDAIILQGSPKYIAVGRVSQQKDYATLLKAFKIVLTTQPSSHLYILGADDKDNNYGKTIRELQQDLNLSDYVTFMGFQGNPYQYIIQSDVFVLSSLYEGMPNVMLEAIYLGKPVAVTNCIPFINQIIEDGILGYKSRLKDPQSLATAMIKASSLKSVSFGTDINKSDKIIADTFNTLLRP